MQKVFSHGLKLDLHIHSVFSSLKDGSKVNFNTLKNVPLLIQKLNEQGVNMCSITDHDVFSYEMYSALKVAENEENSIQKVLPGVEFSVCFSYEGQEKIVHVVAIFSDEDDKKIQAIEKLLNQFRPTYSQAYKEEEFLGLLREIGLNTILIAHQKNTLTSGHPRKNDANILGEVKFLEFVYTDYFEAFEFKNRRNEILNKVFLTQNNLEEKIRFVTGTDCHDWAVYPSETPQEMIETFPYTYAKCLPTFRGLVMAMTDYTRLKAVDSFFAATRYTLPEIKFTEGNNVFNIPLSKGINAIVGDNSVGKSLLLHAMTGFYKPKSLLPASVVNGYKKYLKEKNLNIPQQISQNQIFCFDMQGEVRAKFEENQLDRTEFLAKYFPSPIDNSTYRSLLEREISRMINYLSAKFDYEAKLKKLGKIKIEISKEKAESLTFVNNIGYAKLKSAPFFGIVSQIENINVQLLSLSKLKLEEEDIKKIESISNELGKMKEKYDNKANLIESENDRMETVSKVIVNKTRQHKKSISDAQKKRSEFTENTAELKNHMVELITAYRAIRKYEPYVEKTLIRANTNRVFDYEFVSKLQIDEISTEYFQSLVSRTIKSGKKIDWKAITEKQLQDILLKYDGTPVLQFFKKALQDLSEVDLRPKNSIIYQGMDKYDEFSSGLDAKIYFDLLSYETLQDGIYIIDQPEDNISQSAIKHYLLERFKTMGENRQIIMVTHNPQFVVNLDVDNLIFLSIKDGRLIVQSGALEYSCPEYSVLDIVANNIDGGLDSIKKRWKRYEKVVEL